MKYFPVLRKISGTQKSFNDELFTNEFILNAYALPAFVQVTVGELTQVMPAFYLYL
jgi:hypothetical protein